jgi:hypothetical protein
VHFIHQEPDPDTKLWEEVLKQNFSDPLPYGFGQPAGCRGHFLYGEGVLVEELRTVFFLVVDPSFG